MTYEEIRKKLFQQDDTEEQAQDTTKSTEVKFDDLSKQEQRQLIKDNYGTDYKTLQAMARYEAYDEAKKYADEHQETFKDADRGYLSDLYKVYSEDVSRAAQNNDLTNYYRNRILQYRIGQQLGETSSPITFIQDVGGEIGSMIGKATADVADTIAYGGITAGEALGVTGLNADELYNIAKEPNGTIDKNSESWKRLQTIYQQHPNDEIIEDLYKTVSTQGFKGDKSYFDNVVAYANNLDKTNRYNQWRNQHTLDEQRSVERLDTIESLSYNDIGKFLLDATGVVANMAPSIALGYGVGSSAAGLGASENLITALQGATSLSSMGLSATGNSITTSLDQGYDWGQAGAYGVISGLTEVATELIGGEAVNSLLFGRSISTPMGEAMSKFISKHGIFQSAPFLKGVLMGVADINAEGIEEMISEALDPIYRSTIFKEKDAFDNYGQNILQAYGESILPTLILGGFGSKQIQKSIDNYVNGNIISIQNSTQFTDEQKAKMISDLKEAAADAKIGISQNYDQLQKELKTKLAEASVKDQRARTIYDMLARSEGLTTQEKTDVFNRFTNEKGLMWNPNTKTTQELLDTTTQQTIKYNNPMDIDIDAGAVMGSNKNITDIIPAETTNKAKANIVNVATKIAQKFGKDQVVLADIKTNDGSTVMGATTRDGKNLFINSNLSVKDTLAATYHEIGHTIAEKHPKVFNAVKKALEVKYNTKLDSILREYNNVVGTFNLGDQLTDYQRTYLEEEIFGDLVGEWMSRSKNTKTIEQSTKSLFDKLKEVSDQFNSKYSGKREITNVSDYNLDTLSYLDSGILNNRALEQQVLNIFEGKQTDQVKEATKKTNEILKKKPAKVETAKPQTETKPSSGANARIEQRYAEMKATAKTPAILKMIAEETGLKYDAFNKSGGDNSRLNDILTDLRDDGKITESGTRYSIIGPKAVENVFNKQGFEDFVGSYDQAQEYRKQGWKNEAIRRATGWFRDKYGKWKYEISDVGMKIKTKPEQGKTYKLNEVVSHPFWFRLYPGLKNIKVVVDNFGEGVYGGVDIKNNTIKLNSELNPAGLKLALLHEIQHFIQNMEKSSGGSSLAKGILNYLNTLGEIEATDVENRYKLDKRGLLDTENMPPLSSKRHPLHPLLQDYVEGNLDVGTKGEKVFYSIMDSIYSFVKGDTDVVKYIKENKNQATQTKATTNRQSNNGVGVQDNKPRARLSSRKTEVSNNEFRRLQEESRRELDTKSWKERSQQNDENLRQRLSRAFKEELRYRGYSVSNNNGLLSFSAKGNTFNMYENVDAQTFHDIFEIARTYAENGELVDLHGVKEDYHGVGYEDTKNYLSTDGMQGFALTKDGDLISVFNADLGKRGFLRSIESFIKANAKTLDCYMSPLQDLQKIYSSIFGFKTASIMDFNMEYDHDDIAKNHSKPKVAFMVNTDADVETKYFNKDQYDEAQAYQLSYAKNSKQGSFSMRKTDSNGRILTNAQIEFFKDSKIRDEDGNLLVMYHGTNNEFTIFDIKKAGINYSGYSNLGKGFYFTPSKKLAENWSNGGIKNNKVVEAYLNLKNPFFMGTGNNEISIKKLEEIITNDIEKAKGKKLVLSNYEKTHGESLLSILRNDLGYNANKITEILKECGFDGISKMIEGDYEWGEVVAFYPNQIKLVDNANPTENPDTRFSKRKGTETDRDKIINNQLNKISKLQSKNAELKGSTRRANKLAKSNENLKTTVKGLRKINQGIKSTGRQYIKELQKESDKMLTTGRNVELKLKGELATAIGKTNRLSTAYRLRTFGEQFERKAGALGIHPGKAYKDLFIGLRESGNTVEEAWSNTMLIYTESQRLGTAIKHSMNILEEIRKRSIYNKLPQEIKTNIDAYDQFWSKSAKQTDLSFAKRVLNDATIKELLGTVAITNSVKKQLMDNGKGTVNLADYLDSVEAAEKFEAALEGIRNEIKAFQQRNMIEERTKELEGVTNDIKDDVAYELEQQSNLKLKNFIKTLTNKTLLNSQMTFKTETQAVMGGNLNTPLMTIENNLQNGEIRKKQAIVNVYAFLNKFLTSSTGINKLLGVEKWKKSMEQSLSQKSDWVNTGVYVNGTELKLPRSMMMSLAMHLLNDQNMAHISGAVTRVVTNDKGETSVEFKNGKGVRVPNEQLYKRGQIDEAYDRGKTIQLSYEQVQEIVSQLTEEEQEFIEASKKVLDYTTKLINEVSNKLYGYDLATVENYFPIHTWRKGAKVDPNVNAKMNSEGKLDALSYLTSAGWLQDRTTSFAPIYLENIAEVLSRTINNVTNYYGYAEALRDNDIILNSAYDEPVSFGDGYEADTLREALGSLSSDYLKDYNRLTRFIVGAESLKDGRFRSLMAMNTLTFNIGTWLTQPMSFFNTIKYYTGKEFLSGVNPINNNVKLNKMIRQYYEDLDIDTSNTNDYQLARAFISMATPNLDYRAIGYKTPDMRVLYNKKLADKMGAHGIEAFDNIAVTAIARMTAWNVAQQEGVEFGSEEYFKILGERLTQVLVETQPEFSHINRANMFRSTNPLLRALSLFGTPANQMFNNFVQSAMQVRYEAREGKVSNKAKTSLAKSISGIVLSSVTVALVRALRDQIRSDDDEVSLQDRWLAQTIIAMLGPTLILDDFAQLIMSSTGFGGVNTYDFNTPETTYLNGLTNVYKKVTQLFNEGISPTQKVVDLVKAMGIVTPVDTKGIIRDLTAFMKIIAPEAYSAYKLQTNSTIYKKWLENSDTDMAEFYKAYTNTRNNVLEAKYGYHKGNKELGIESNLRESREKALQDVFNDQATVDKYMEILFNYKK